MNYVTRLISLIIIIVIDYTDTVSETRSVSRLVKCK